MKTLIYAMQNSGASLFAFWLSQQTECLGIIDLYYNQLAPCLEHKNVVIKCVVTKDLSLEEHLDSFKPDRTILFIRNPIENYLGLSEKIYANYGGTIEEKLEIMDNTLAKNKHNFLLRYEDFISKRVPEELGDKSYFQFNKTIEKIKQYNFLNNNWCKENYRKKWGIGNIHLNSLQILRENNYQNISKMY